MMIYKYYTLQRCSVEFFFETMTYQPGIIQRFLLLLTLFFSFRFYWFINVGSAIAFSAVVYVQQEINFFIGYIIPAVSLIFGLIVFLLPRNLYEQETLTGELIFSMNRNAALHLLKITPCECLA